MDAQTFEQVQMVLGKLGEVGDFAYQAARQRVLMVGFVCLVIWIIVFSFSMLMYFFSYQSHQEDATSDDMFGWFVFGSFILLLSGIPFYEWVTRLFSTDWATIQLIISTAKGL